MADAPNPAPADVKLPSKPLPVRQPEMPDAIAALCWVLQHEHGGSVLVPTEQLANHDVLFGAAWEHLPDGSVGLRISGTLRRHDPKASPLIVPPHGVERV